MTGGHFTGGNSLSRPTKKAGHAARSGRTAPDCLRQALMHQRIAR
ncbi:MAG: hypothetical protein OJF52_003121 [Nitrospira sp.]|nr:MAG: hypothetical protein OJF52_003121 [Nitrospira sp.]